jgi:hypothetical protein
VSTFRNRRRSSFTTAPNEAIRDANLSLQATGLLMLMLSFPDDWEYRMTHLTGLKTNGRDAFRSALRELEEAGYVKKEPRRNEDGTMAGWEWEVRDYRPQETVDGFPVNGGPDNRMTGNPPLGEPVTTKNETTKRAEKPNGFSALRQQAQASSRKQEPGRFSSGKLSPSEPPLPSPAPQRKLSPNQQFIKLAGETWNELKHPSWPECDVKKPSVRAIKYLQALFASEDKDVQKAVETVRLGLKWIRSKDEWASGQVFTWEQMLANEKLEAAASKARHHIALGSSATPARGPGSAARSANVGGILVGESYHLKDTSEVVTVVEDLLGNGQLLLVEDPETGQRAKRSYYELHPIHHNTTRA